MGGEAQATVSIVYGYAIELPNQPNWEVFVHRLEQEASKKATKRKLDDDDEHPTTDFLVDRDNGDFSAAETDLDEFDDPTEDVPASVEEAANKLMNKVLRTNKHGLVLSVHFALDDQSQDAPVMLLIDEKSAERTGMLWYGARHMPFKIPSLSKKDENKIEERMDKVLDHLNLESSADKPGWHFVSCLWYAE